jgi:hypothetical protein
MIEGGNAGGSARVQAAERTAQAERLLHEASRLEVAAADEQAMAAQLCELPATHAVLHDLTLPDGRGRVDHVVVGPGGAFLVLTRRVDHALVFEDGRLLAGSAPLTPLFDAARVEAQALTQALGTAVVPIVGVVGAAMPASIPPAVDGVLVCQGDQVAAVIGRGAHTQLSSEQVTVIADRAVPLLTVAGTRSRTVAAAPIPPPPPTAPVSPVASVPAAVPPSARRAAPVDHSHRSRRFVIAAIVSGCLVAFAAGALMRVLFSDEPNVDSSSTLVSGVASTTIVVPGAEASTTLPSAAPGSTSVPVAAVPAPKVAFLPVCPTPTAGWALVPAWPGDLVGLARYDVELLGPDGNWSVVNSFPTADAVTASVTGLAPNTTVTLRIAAVMGDGSRSAATATPVIVPATAC